MTNSDSAPWITYRPELKVLDCTIRDGGLVNDSHFSDEQVRNVYTACVESGIDYMEIGYKNSLKVFPADTYGPWRHCQEEDMRRAVGDHDAESTGLKLCAMADAGDKSEWKSQIGSVKDSVLDMIRVACYVHQIEEAADMVRHCHEHGYETCLNIMAISVAQQAEINQSLQIARDLPIQALVVVDSYGNLYREQVDQLVKLYQDAVAGTDIDVGIHAHNNLQLGFANTIEAIILGANRADSTLFGMGRGAGNCPTELLLGFLKNPKFNMRPIYKVLQETILPLRVSYDWGPSVPYQITGQFNRHPRSAISFRAGDTPDDYLSFYNQTLSDI